MVAAWRSASGSISTRVGWKLRLTTGRITLLKSAWWWRLSSWNGPRLNCEVGTFAVIESSAEELVCATASAMIRFAEPGPVEVSVAAGRWLTRKKPSAMWPAVCSWRGETSFTWSRTS